MNDKKSDISDKTTYFSKSLFFNYISMKGLEYKLINQCITECLNIEEQELSQKEQECLKICNNNIITFFKISSKNYEESQLIHSPQIFKEMKKRLPTDNYD